MDACDYRYSSTRRCHTDACCTVEGQDLCHGHAVEALATMDSDERRQWFADTRNYPALDKEEAFELVQLAEAEGVAK